MTWNRSRLLKIAGLGTGVLGALALVVVLAPVVWGQSAQTPRKAWGLDLIRFSGSLIGVEVRDADEADVKREKLAASTGAVVENVQAEGPAAKAGMKAGDVIVSFDGERVRSAKHLERLVSETPEGRTVDATVMRDGAKVNLKVTATEPEPFARLKEYTSEFRNAQPYTMTLPKMDAFNWSSRPGLAYTIYGRAKLGIGVQDLTDQLGEYFGAPAGALVTAVDDGTPAKAAGLKAGDVITKVNGTAVRDSNDLRRQLSAASGETTLTVIRDRKEVTLKAKIE